MSDFIEISGNYPIGAAYDSAAPYNENLDRTIQVEVVLTMSKSVSIDMRQLEQDDDFYTEDELREAVRKQIILPQDAYLHSDNITAKSHLKGWEVEYFEVID